MSNENCQKVTCDDEDCYCRIFDGPLSIHIEGGFSLELETACLKNIKKIGLTEEQFEKVRGVLDFLSKLKESKSNGMSNQTQLKALQDVMKLFSNHSDNHSIIP